MDSWGGKGMAERHGKRLGTRFALLAVGLLALASSGCLVIAAGAASGAAVGYFYYRGEICKYYSAGPEATFAATRAALLDLNMPILREENNGARGSIEATTAQNEKVHVSLHQDTDNGPAPMTRVGVRVGTFGNEEISATLLGQIEARLSYPGSGRLVPQAAPTLGPIQPVSPVGIPNQTPPPPLAGEPPTTVPVAANQTAPPPLAPLQTPPPPLASASASAIKQQSK
jgi:hypothetical protein